MGKEQNREQIRKEILDVFKELDIAKQDNHPQSGEDAHCFTIYSALEPCRIYSNSSSVLPGEKKCQNGLML